MSDKKIKRLKSTRPPSVNKRFINTLMKRTRSESADKLEALRHRLREKYRKLAPSPTRIPHYEDDQDWRAEDNNSNQNDKASPRKRKRNPLRDKCKQQDREEDDTFADESSNRLVVFNIGDTNEELLHNVFQPCGEISKVDIILDKETNASRGFGFVEFYRDEDAKRAEQACDGLIVDGRPIRVQFSRNTKGDGDTRFVRKHSVIQDRLLRSKDDPRKYKSPIKIYNRRGRLMKNKDIRIIKPDPLMLLQGIPHLANSFIAGNPNDPMNKGEHTSRNNDLSENLDSNSIAMFVSEAKQQNCTPFSVPDRSIISIELEKEMESYYGPVEENMRKSSGVITASEVSNITSLFPVNTSNIDTSVVNSEEGSLVNQVNEDGSLLNEDKEEELLKKKKEAEYANAMTTLYYYWDVVRDNPYDFDGWTILLGHAETMEMVDHLRSGFEGFLPYFPYCYGYWEKLSEVELKSHGIEKCLGVLFISIECVPMNEHLWILLFKTFVKYAMNNKLPIATIRNVYEHGLSTIGISWHSSKFWEECIEFEINNNNFRHAMDLYRRLLKIPLKLTNRHYDCMIAFLYENNPRDYLLEKIYQKMRKDACEKLNIRYHSGMLRGKPGYKGKHPEELIADEIKFMLNEEYKKLNDDNVVEVNKRWVFEERIQRPYFHVRSIEKRQLKNWDNYLEFELKESDPVRIISLYERCLVSAALYEDYWSRYALYLEKYVTASIEKRKISEACDKSKCDTDKETTECVDGDVNTGDNITTVLKKFKLARKNFHYRQDFEPCPESQNININQEQEQPGTCLNSLKYQFCSGINVGNFVLKSPPLTREWIETSMTWEDVRHVYRRAVWVHCPNKPRLLVQWAEFEIKQGDLKSAKDLLNAALEKLPNYLKARMLLIQLELNDGNEEFVNQLYMKGFRALGNESELAWLATKYSRFLFKHKHEPQKSLTFLRKALKKYRSYPYLYHLLFDICYEQVPVDIDGALASLQLALASKDVDNNEKLWISYKKYGFLTEHGSIQEIRESRQYYLNLKKEIAEEKLKQQKKDAKLSAKLIEQTVNAKTEQACFTHRIDPNKSHLHPDKFYEAQSLVERFHPRPYYMPYMYTQKTNNQIGHNSSDNMNQTQSAQVEQRHDQNQDSIDFNETEQELMSRLKKMKNLCKYGNTCMRQDCMFVHRPRCLYGWKCRKNKCDFWHDAPPPPRIKCQDGQNSDLKQKIIPPSANMIGPKLSNLQRLEKAPLNNAMNSAVVNIDGHLSNQIGKESRFLSFPTNSTDTGKQSNYCKMCNQNFSNSKLYMKHLESVPLHRLEGLLAIEVEKYKNNTTLDELKEDQQLIRTMSDPTVTFRCFVCNLNNVNMKNYKCHIVGKRHEKEINRSIHSRGGLRNINTRCDVCEIDFSVNKSPEQYFQHMKSPYHSYFIKKKINSQESTVIQPNCDIVETSKDAQYLQPVNLPVHNNVPVNDKIQPPSDMLRELFIIHDGLFCNLRQYLNIQDKIIQICQFDCDSITDILDSINDIVGGSISPIFIIHVGMKLISSKLPSEYAANFNSCAMRLKELFPGCVIAFILMLPSKLNTDNFDTKRLQFNKALKAGEGDVYHIIKNGEFDCDLEEMYESNGNISCLANKNVANHITNFLQSILK